MARFTGLSLVSEPWWSLISEVLEVFTLGIMWVTAILYLRHLVPRHLTVTAQALPVIAHFCVGTFASWRCNWTVRLNYWFLYPTYRSMSRSRHRCLYQSRRQGHRTIAEIRVSLYGGSGSHRCRPVFRIVSWFIEAKMSCTHYPWSPSTPHNRAR